MIDLFFWPTPNGLKPLIFLKETGLAYQLKPIDINAGEQFQPTFLSISPNNRIPAILDHAPADSGKPLSVFESGAILIYLAEKTGRFFSDDLRQRVRVLEWLMWQMGGLGPMLGQNHHFNIYAPEKVPYAVQRYNQEASRLYAVLDGQLNNRAFICDEYSIADMACYPWVSRHERHQIDLAAFPNVQRWFSQMGARPAVVSAYEEAERVNEGRAVTAGAGNVLFGQTAETIRRAQNAE